MTLTEFLLARIAEDLEVAEDQRKDEQFVYGTDRMYRVAHAQVGMAPHRAVAECEAKRRIVEPWATGEQPARIAYFMQHERELRHVGDLAEVVRTLRLLALPYAHHPDYREEWRP